MSLSIRSNEPMKQYTTLQVGGIAEYFVEVDSEALLAEAVAHAHTNGLPLTVLGGGSNVLVADQGIEGLVIRMTHTDIVAEVSGDTVLLTAAAGVILDDLVQYAVTNGYWGIENLSHIPGTVGAAPVQNVGAYGVEIQDVVQSVRVYNTDTQAFERVSAEACGFGYRDSLFKKPEGKKYIVTAVTFALTTQASPNLSYKDLHNRFSDTQPALADIRTAVIAIRAVKFPDWKVVGTAGSFFKNPVVSQAKFEELSAIYPGLPGFPAGDDLVKIPLGWILDKVLHLKGGGTASVGAYQGQALVLIHKADATAENFISFADEITGKVLDATGIEIQWEVTKVGF